MIEATSAGSETLPGRVWPWALSASAMSLVVAVLFFDVPTRGLHEPRFDRGDGLFHAFLIDSVNESGWYGVDPRLGATFGSSLLDFPVFDWTHLAVLRAVSIATEDPFAIETAFLIATFGFVAFGSTFAFAQHVRSRALGSVGGFLFAILPYHFLRLHHFFLADYASVALYGAIVVDVVSGAPTLFATRRRRLLVGFGLLGASGCGVYYAFFGCLLVVAAALRAWSRHRSTKSVAAAVAMVTIVSIGVSLQALPTILHQRDVGENPSVAHRAPAESETYGLKPIELFLPMRHHRVPALDAIAADYEEASPLSNENTNASLGVLGSLGLVIALGSFFSGRPRPHERRRELGFLIVVALLYAAVGGGASIFAHLVVASIRSANRISVFIAFFALLALLEWVDDRLRRTHGRRRHVLTVAICFVFGFVGLVDQVPTGAALPAVDAGFRARDRRFDRAIESAIGTDASMLVLPYVRFPEGRGWNGLDSYEPLRLVLASRTLSWSYGGMAGRASDLYARSLVRESPDVMARQAVRAGFDGIVVLRDGYRDRGESLVAALTVVAGAPIAVDAERVAFRLDASLGDGARDHVAFALHSGFFGWERFGDSGTGSWSRGDAAIVLVHRGARSEPVTFSATVGSPHPRAIRFSYLGRIVATVRLDALERRRIEIPLDVPHGTSRLTISSDRPPESPGNGDRRAIGFGLASISISPR